ncbi:hypothetical protein ACCO45_009429 [Purpureocillium lilacinum]|uniref:Uncharacterized protein n=1 Tax=Purpureocillium lilacinum TaxID=33203 RepID=A0ACC4DKS6_PURLI
MDKASTRTTRALLAKGEQAGGPIRPDRRPLFSTGGGPEQKVSVRLSDSRVGWNADGTHPATRPSSRPPIKSASLASSASRAECVGYVGPPGSAHLSLPLPGLGQECARRDPDGDFHFKVVDKAGGRGGGAAAAAAMTRPRATPGLAFSS